MGNSPVTSSPVVLHNNAIIRDVGDIGFHNDDVTLALTFFPNNAVLDVSIRQVSEVSLAYTSNQDDTIRHYGVIVRNEFHVSDGGIFQYLVFHALQQNNVPNATKIDIFFANSIEDTENRLRGVININDAVPVVKRDFTPASEITTAPIIANAIRGYLSAEFDYGLNRMALQDYEGLANCFLVAIHFHSICLGNNPTEANEIVEAELQLIRGKLLRASGVDINQIQEGIPCSDIFFWETKKEATTPVGIFRLQTHKSCRPLGVIGLFLLLSYYVVFTVV